MNKSLTDFIKKIKGKKTAVIGVAVSNTPLIEFLSKYGARITAFDKSEAPSLADRINRLKPCKIEYRLGPDYLKSLRGYDYIFRTPALRPDIPELTEERGRGAVITSEMELFLELCPATVFGVTGSDGKTTTTTLIYEMLKAHGYNCYLGGNIGKPLLAGVGAMKSTDMAVVELSSFQLLEMKKSVNIAVITNLSPNHLDVHKSYDEYVSAKKNIFMRQSPEDLLVLNYEDGQTRALYSEAPGRFGFFGGGGADGGASCAVCPAVKKPFAATYVDGGNIIYQSFSEDSENDNGKYDHGAARVLRVDDIAIPGAHNIANYLAAICAVYRYADRGDILATAKGFAGVEHRIEHVRTLDGVYYYNDSASSSPTRAIACLNTFDQRVILITGGGDKNLDFAPLAPYLFNKVKIMILCGDTSNKIKLALREYCDRLELPNPVRIIECDSYENAVNAARENAHTGDRVVLSPAGTSFDRFNNFEERGRYFKNLVNGF